ncbi:MAG: hypothetical protein J0L92_38430 [Deltaproteobacteria bacterium]|nr:hypothetical protein [Deltaproteobacteria bacterium]
MSPENSSGSYLHTSSSTEPAAFTAEDMECAYVAMQPAIEALSIDDCPSITLDVDTTASNVLAAVSRLAPYEAQLQALPGIGEPLGLLRTYALGVMHAQLRIRMAERRAPATREVQRLARLRETFLADLTPLVRREILDGEFLDRLNVASGARNLANDLLLLASVAERGWPRIARRTAMTTQSIAEAREVATEVLSALVAREGRSRSVDPTGQRLRAFTLLMRAYDDVRRGMTFLLWKRGAAAIDAVTPSLFKGRGPRAKKEAPATDEVTPDARDGSPGPANSN